MLLEGVYQRLSTDAGVTAIAGDRVYPGLAEKEAALPYCVYTQVGASPVTSFDGNNRLQDARVRFSCYAAEYKASKQLANAIKNSLAGLAATLSDGTEVQGAWLEFEGDNVERDTEGTIFGSHVDFVFHFVDNA
jgi:Protein of unknown function (DUF3168)